jgi:hypothetical protein
MMMTRTSRFGSDTGVIKLSDFGVSDLLYKNVSGEEDDVSCVTAGNMQRAAVLQHCCFSITIVTPVCRTAHCLLFIVAVAPSCDVLLVLQQAPPPSWRQSVVK